MNTLRVKIAILLVVVIVSVMGLFTVVLFYLMGPPPRAERALDTVAQQVEMVAGLVEQGDPDLELAAQPAMGRPYLDVSNRLKALLASRGIDLAVKVTRSERGAPLIVSIPFGDKGWLLMPASNLPPAGPPWRVLFKWFAIITFGATVIAVFVANRMVKPLVFLENAVDNVGPDGMLPLLPERGPAEVRATAKALNSLSARLKRAMESRMRLVAAAGHDLRTPITRMRLRAEFVEDEEERARWLTDLEELERIADSAILLVREESGKAPPEIVRLDELIGHIGEELREQNLDVTAETSQPVTVRASKLTLNRALRNLIINAATHGMRARVEVDGANGATARIVIDDDGPGIPTDLLGQVFEPFFRANPARRKDIPGAGLGLTIAKEIIQRAGGTISISNRDGGGLRQVIELPKASEAAPL